MSHWRANPVYNFRSRKTIYIYKAIRKRNTVGNTHKAYFCGKNTL